MFEACEAFVWCLKDNFYAIYGHLKKKVQKFQSGIFGFFLTAMASRLSVIASTNILRQPSQKKNQKSKTECTHNRTNSAVIKIKSKVHFFLGRVVQ